MNAKPKFMIIANGIKMGIYDGKTQEDALDAYSRDAGYQSYVSMKETIGADDSEIEIKFCKGDDHDECKYN
jgi:hypothetical protein